jgi:hypothetical protein
MVDATVPLSIVWEDALEPGGEREKFVLRPVSLIAGVVKDRGRVEVGRLVVWMDPEAKPKLCVVNLSPRGVFCLFPTGTASSAVGGTPL